MTINVGNPATPSTPTQRAQLVADLGLPTAAVLSALVAGAGTPPSAAQVAALSAQLFNADGTAKRLTMQAIEFAGSAASQFLTVPDNQTMVEMEGTGRGGGGGGNGGGGGSAGQQMYRRAFRVIPGETLTVNAPPGGAAGSSSGNAGSPVPDGISGSVLTVTGSLSGQLVALTAGGGGRASGQGGDASGPRFNTGVAAPAAGLPGVIGTAGNAWLTENSPYGNSGGMGGSGAESTGAAIAAGAGARVTNTVQAGIGGNTGAVSGQRAGGGGGAGWPDMSVGTGESGGNGGGHNQAGQAGKTPGAGGGGGGTNQPGGAGAPAKLWIYI